MGNGSGSLKGVERRGPSEGDGDSSRDPAAPRRSWERCLSLRDEGWGALPRDLGSDASAGQTLVHPAGPRRAKPCGCGGGCRACEAAAPWDAAPGNPGSSPRHTPACQHLVGKVPGERGHRSPRGHRLSCEMPREELPEMSCPPPRERRQHVLRGLCSFQGCVGPTRAEHPCRQCTARTGWARGWVSRSAVSSEHRVDTTPARGCRLAGDPPGWANPRDRACRGLACGWDGCARAAGRRDRRTEGQGAAVGQSIFPPAWHGTSTMR